MADKDLDARLAQTVEIGAILGVRALNLMAPMGEDFSNPTHPNPANADNVDGADIEGDGVGAHEDQVPSQLWLLVRSKNWGSDLN
jgi:hypothetical protein